MSINAQHLASKNNLQSPFNIFPNCLSITVWYHVSRIVNHFATWVATLTSICLTKITNLNCFETLANIMNDINELPLHPKNKILLYSRYVLSKISWHFIVSDMGKTWVIENLDNIASKYIRKWLELPISTTLSNVQLPHNKFGLNIILPSTKFLQCQIISRQALKTSPNEDIKNLWIDTCKHKNVQYDKYKNTKDVLNTIRKEHKDKLQNHLISQGSFFCNIIKYSTLSLNSMWSSVQSKLPKNIFNFTIRYINNTLPTRKNMFKWGLTSTSDCSFCLQPETLLHVIAGCNT